MRRGAFAEPRAAGCALDQGIDRLPGNRPEQIICCSL
jgi:hypothetical protein